MSGLSSHPDRTKKTNFYMVCLNPNLTPIIVGSFHLIFPAINFLLKCLDLNI